MAQLQSARFIAHRATFKSQHADGGPQCQGNRAWGTPVPGRKRLEDPSAREAELGGPQCQGGRGWGTPVPERQKLGDHSAMEEETRGPQCQGERDWGTPVPERKTLGIPVPGRQSEPGGPLDPIASLDHVMNFRFINSENKVEDN